MDQSGEKPEVLGSGAVAAADEAPAVDEGERESQALEGENGSEDREEDDGLCRQCGQKPRDTSASENSVLCSQCRQGYVRLRIPKGVLFFLAAIGAVFLLAMIHMPKTVEQYKRYLEAERHMGKQEYLFAYQGYAELLEDYGGSVPIILNAIDAAMGAQLFDEAATLLDSRLVGRGLDDKQYARATEVTDDLDTFYLSVSEVSPLLENVGSDEESLAALYESLRELLDSSVADKTLIYYYLGNLAPTLEESAEYFRLASLENELFTYPIAVYGNVLRRAGLYDEAEQVYRHALERNACDASSIAGLGILELLRGDAAQGVELTRKAFETDPFTAYIPEAYTIALCENGKREEALGVVDSMEAAGYLFDAELTEYFDGTVSLERYYLTQGGE